MKSHSIEPGRSRWIGRVLRDRWRIDERLSRGGVGTVYAATHKNNGSRAAIKVLHPEFSQDPDTRSRFLQEGYAANQVNHPGVVRILDDDTTEDGHSYLVMELLEGELLEKRRVRKGGQLPLSEVFQVADQLLDVLAAAHAQGIVHRDIKPENLFITREGRLKVLDFGFAQMKSGFRKEQTATGFLLGTPGFMSPEQAVGNRAQIDDKTDIWAVGATLFTLISGEPVHDGNSAAEMLVAAANFPPRSLSSVTSALPPRLVEIVDRAVAFDKSHRWANARAMQSALREVVARASMPARPQTYSIPDREPIADDAEELGDEDLVSGSWQGGGPALRYRADQLIDEDGPTLTGATLAGDSHPPTERPPPTPLVPRPGDDSIFDATADGGTLIMEGRGSRHDDEATEMDTGAPFGSGPPAPLSMPPPSPPPRTSPQPFGQQHTAFGPAPVFDPVLHGGMADDGRFSSAPVGQTGPQRTVAPMRRREGGSKVLVFIGIAVVTMVVVVVGGLLFLTYAD